MTMYRSEGHEFDTGRQELRRGGEIIPLEPQVFAVLAHLVAHHDRLVGKDELLDEGSYTRFVPESALTSRIKAARKAIGDPHRSTPGGKSFGGSPRPSQRLRPRSSIARSRR